MKLKKVGIALCLSAGLLVLGACSTQKSVIKDVKVDFSGYNHEGKAKLSGKYYDEITETMKKKEGMSASDILVKIDKSSGLTNGDKVKVSILSKLKKSPIKPESKTFTVSGLKKSTYYTIDDVLKDNELKLAGFNHYGLANYNKAKFSIGGKTTYLSNGDKITVNLNNSYREKESDKGRILKGSSSKEIQVSGLEETAKISNLDELLAKMDSLAGGTNDTVTRQGSYFVGTNVKNSMFSDPSETVGQFSVISIYKIDQNMDGIKGPTIYTAYGYAGLELKNGKVDISSLNSGNEDGRYQNFKSDQEVLDSLKSSYSTITELK